MNPNSLGRPLKLFLQQPASAHWVHAATLIPGPAHGGARFQYTDVYLSSSSAAAIDPINLPLRAEPIEAPRYNGMPDVIRDICPDTWGARLLSQNETLGPISNWRILLEGGTFDRWGALSVGTIPQRSFEFLSIERLAYVCSELEAIQKRRSARDTRIRQKILSAPNLGGARPKTTLRDEQSLWILKPKIESDEYDVPALEHFTALLGTMCGLNFAKSRYLFTPDGHPAIVSRRFDRDLHCRAMVLSAATLLGVEYPPVSSSDHSDASYGRLAEVLLAIGAPVEDCIELYRRMAFNVLMGNDDDHPRNHAVIYSANESRWRLAPAYDVVPNLMHRPTGLAMGLDDSVKVISRQAMLAVASRFGINNQVDANDILCSLSLNLCKALVDLRPPHPAWINDRIGEQIVSGLLQLDLWTDRHQEVLSHVK